MALRDAEVDNLLKEVIPDILRRLEELEKGIVVEVEEKDGIYEYGVLSDEPASGSV